MDGSAFDDGLAAFSPDADTFVPAARQAAGCPVDDPARCVTGNCGDRSDEIG
jgi:hypothetical protein